MENQQEMKKLENRLENLENHVYNGNGSGGSSDKVGYLQKKLRECGEKIQEMESQMETLQGKVERKKDIEDVQEEIDKDKRHVEKQLEEFEERIQEANEVVEEFQEGEETLNEVVDRWNDSMSEYDDMIVKQAEDIATWTISSHRMVHATFSRQFRKYFPRCERSEQIFEKITEGWKLTPEQFNELEDMFTAWMDFVDSVENSDVETPTDLRQDTLAFKSWMLRKESQRRIDEEVGDDFKVMSEEKQAEVLDGIVGDVLPQKKREDMKEMCKRFDVDPDRFQQAEFEASSAGGFMEDKHVRRILVEVYLTKDNVDLDHLEEHLDNFLERFSGTEEGYQQMLELVGVNEKFSEKVDLWSDGNE